MNNSELKAKLHSVRVPERSGEYWEDFPAQVRRNLSGVAPQPVAENLWRPRLAWAGGLAFALALIFLSVQFHPLQTASAALTKQERHFRTQVAQLETGLQKLMCNTHGMGHLLADVN